MSYHGISLDKPQAGGQAIKRTGMQMGEMKRCVRRALSSKGVYHFDMAARNLLWCYQHKALVVIDFEHAN